MGIAVILVLFVVFMAIAFLAYVGFVVYRKKVDIRDIRGYSIQGAKRLSFTTSGSSLKCFEKVA